MKKIIYIIGILFLSLINAGIAIAQIPPLNITDLQSGKHTLNVGYISNYVPFYFSDGVQPKGLDPDIFNHLTKQMNIKNVQYKPYHNYVELNKALLKGDTDITACDYWVLPMNPQSIALTEPYYNRGGMAVVYLKNKHSFKVVQDLKGVSVGIAKIEGDVVWMLKKKYFSQSHIQLYNNYDDVINAVRTNKVAAAYMPYSLYLYLQNQNNTYDMEVIFIKKYPSVYALRKEDQPFITLLNQTITSLQKDGTLSKITNPWVGYSESNKR